MFSKLLSLACVVPCVLASAETPKPGHRLIAFNETYSTWMSLEDVYAMGKADSGVTGFMDITDSRVKESLSQKRRAQPLRIPTTPVHQTTVNAAISDNLCTNGADNNCYGEVLDMSGTLSDYFTRFYTTETGREAVLWLADQYRALIGERSDINVMIFEHSFGIQPSLIVSWIGSESPEETVVIGGHIDSTAGGATQRAPGFDDDASGSSTVFVAFKTLLESDFLPSRTLEFHAYAAEEVGLRGSQAVAQYYADVGRDVVSMVQFDMTCYSQNKEVGLTSDFTNPELTTFVRACVDTYTTMGSREQPCGYACSDHASFNTHGYPSAFPFEAPFGSHNPSIHTAQDTQDKCDPEYMGEFAKLAVAMAVELSA